MLKSFFRNLPDSLFTAELYPKFIEADKIVDPKVRMVTLRKLVSLDFLLLPLLLHLSLFNGKNNSFFVVVVVVRTDKRTAGT